jgi:hypothetical protein
MRTLRFPYGGLVVSSLGKNGWRIIVGTHQKATAHKTAASIVTTGVALQLVGLLGFSYATDTFLPGLSLLGATSIFIDGTKDILPTNDDQSADRMKNSLNGAFNQETKPTPGTNVFIDYPRSFGILTGLGDPGYNESNAIATDKTLQAIKDARTDNPCVGSDCPPIYVVGFSQGANVASDVVRQLEEEGYNGQGITFVMVGNGARNNGGIWARLPAAVYVPLLGLSFGASTNPSTDPNAPQVIQISKQYDGAADVPKYVLNPVAWANTVMGFFYVHNGYYADVDMDLDDDGDVDQDDVTLAENDPEGKYIVTRNGNVTDVLIKNPEGQLPLSQALRSFGVPAQLVNALEPLLRAIIETAYDRAPNGGVYPAEPVHLRLLPGPSHWPADAAAIATGLTQTIEQLGTPSTNQMATMQVSPPSAAPSNNDVQLRTMALPSATTPSVTQSPPPRSVEARVSQTPTVDPSPSSEPPKSDPPQMNIVRGPIGGSPTPIDGDSNPVAVNGVVVTDSKAPTTGAADANQPGEGSPTGTTTTTTTGTTTTTTTNTTDTTNDTGANPGSGTEGSAAGSAGAA